MVQQYVTLVFYSPTEICLSLTELIPSEPPQLPGKCPEPKRGRSWIPFRGHCYYVHTTSEESWPDASMMCIQMGKCLFY